MKGHAMRLVVANLKGGVGKTVSAVCLGLLLNEEAPVTLIDADPQGSALSWSELAQFPFPVIAPPAPYLRALPRRLPDLAPGSTHVVIDTPPGDAGIVRSALSAADTVLIPVKTYGMDLARLTATVDLLAELEARHRPDWFVLLTQTRANTVSAREARALLVELGLPILDAEIPLREAIGTASGSAQPDASDYKPVRDALQETHR
jgi:chromosome partitioning protein